MFLIFAGECFYASGGAYDLCHNTEDEKEALDHAKGLLGRRIVTDVAEWSDDRTDDDTTVIEWSHVFDTSKQEVVAEFGDCPLGAGNMPLEIR